MDESLGAEFHSPPYPEDSPGCQCTGEAFVDNTALWILRMGLLFMMLINLMQQSAQRWARLIYGCHRWRVKPPQVFLVWHSVVIF
jgi:hypothetical protein